MKPSTLLFCATTAQAAVLWWPQQQQHHAPGQPCGHHVQQGQVSEQVTQTGPFSFRFPFIRHIRIIWPLSNRPILPSPAEIANQVFDHTDQQQEEATEEATPPPQAETVQQEEEKEVTILPYTGHLDGPEKAEEIKPKEKVEGEEEEEDAHEDLRRRKQPAQKHRVKRQFPGQFRPRFGFPITSGSIPLYGQCDGRDFHGPFQSCELGSYCRYKDQYYSQCVPLPTPPGYVARYGQCGGRNYHGSPFCELGTECKFQNDFYSQCL